MTLKRALKKLAKYTAYILLGILGVLIVLLIALRLPVVQTFIAQKATSILAEKTGGHISVNQVRINFIDNVLLKGVYIEEPNGDTLLYAKRLEVDISLWRILKQEIHIDAVELEDAVGNLSQSPETGDFNFQYIIDAFSDTTAIVDTTPSNWVISARQAYLTKVRFNLDIEGLKLNTYVSEADLELDKLDLVNQSIDADHINISNSQVTLFITSISDSTAVDSVGLISSPMDFPLPDVGWAFSIEDVKLENLKVKIDQANQPNIGGFDYNHLDISNINAELEDVAWEHNLLEVNIEGISLNSADGTVIEHLTGDLAITEKGINVQGFALKSTGIDIALDAQVQYTSFNQLLTFDPNTGVELDLEKANIKLGALEPFLPFLWTDGILAPKAREAIINLAIKANGTIGDLKLDLVELSTNSITKVKLSGNAQGLPDYKTATFQVKLNQLTTDYYDLLAIIGEVGIPKGVSKFGTIRLTGDIGGRLDSIDAKKVLLSTQKVTGLSGNIRAIGLPAIANTRFTLNLNYLKTRSQEIAPFVGDTLPEMLTKLGTVAYSGTFDGTITDMSLKGLLSSDLGTLKADLSANFNDTYTQASYDGKVRLDTFHLGALLGTEDLGRISLSATAKGQGLSLDSIHTTIDAIISEVEAKKYTYHNISIGGKMDKMQFNGSIHIDDPNLKFDFDGLVNLDTANTELSFIASLDTINLHKLNITTTPIGISMQMDVDLKGFSSIDVDGKAVLLDIKINDSTDVFIMDSFVVEAYANDTGKTIQISSPVINGFIAGRYNLEALPTELQAFIASYVDNVGDSIIKPYKVKTPQQFDMLLTISKPQPLIDVLAPGLILDTASITGRFDNEKGDLIITAIIPEVRYDSLSINKVTVRTGGRGKLFGAMVMVDSLTYGNEIDIPHTRLFTFFRNDSLRYGLNIYDADTSFYRLKMGGYMQQNDDEYWFSFDRPLILNGETWTSLVGNKLIVAPKGLNFEKFGFENGQKRFQFNTPDTTNGKNPLQISFNNFPLGELSELVSYEGLDFGGTINGAATVYDVKQSLDFVSDITIKDIEINESSVGDMSINGSRSGSNIDVGIVLSGANSMTLLGKIDTKTQEINAGFNIAKIDLKIFDPFLRDFVKDSEGSINAEATIRGTYSKPEIDGHVGFNGVKTFVLFAGTQFQIPNHDVNFTSSQITLNSLQLKDARGDLATLDGKITHDYFKDFQFNLRFKTNGFQFLNTKRDIRELFYGTLILSVDARITGTPALPILDVATSTKKGTNLTVSPLTLEEGIQDAAYVIYHNPNSGDTLVTQKRYSVTSLPIDLTLNLEVTDDAYFVVVVDAGTGDQLDLVAEGNLAVNIPANGNISIIGGLDVVSGSYRMTQAFLKRKFIIEKGSRIDLSGDPMDARLSINAIYATKISTFALIGDQATTLTPQEQSDAKKPSNVEVVLTMRGVLSSPIISFDIRLPNESGISSIASRRLQQMRQDQNEINTQVFAILLMNSFISSGSTSSGGGIPGVNTALKSVSGLVNQQLSRFTSKVKDFSVNIDASSYEGYSTTDANNTVTELGVSVSKGLFDNRLELKAGGDVNLESNTGSANQGSGFTQWAGNFVLEYKLTENGKYRVKIFNTSDYNLLYQNNVNRTGVGLTFQHSFRKRKKVEEQEKMPLEVPLPVLPNDTIPNDSIPTIAPKTKEQE
jgi:hypothetical protein